MITEYDQLVNKVAIHLSNCPESAVIDALRHTVRDFCKRTKTWIFDNPVIDTEADQLSYDLSLPDESTVFHLWGLNGRTGDYRSLDDVYLSQPAAIVFSKQPSSHKQIKPLLSLMPTVSSTGFPSHIHEMYEEHLIAGAVGYLQLQPFREWSQPNAASTHFMKYEQGIVEAKRLRDEGLNISKAHSRVRPQYI